MSHSAQILPCLHPTTVLFVDDSKLFARSLSLRIPPDLAVEVIEDPRPALNRMNAEIDSGIQPEMTRSSTGGSVVGGRMEFDAARVQDALRFAGRFSRVSVVVADFGMPAMSGLQLCSQIRDPSVQKVLITGLADHAQAVDAFNQRSIQGFIPKGEPTFFTQLFVAIRELKYQYFVAKARHMESVLRMERPTFTNEPCIAEYFQALCKRLSVVEHYVGRDPPGVLMVSNTGDVQRLVVLDEAQLAEQLAFASDAGATSGVLGGLASKSK